MKDFRRFNRIVVGGPLGVAAWAMSGVCAAAIAVWGLNAAVPVLIVKGASWSLWGFGVLRESARTRRMGLAGTAE